jgi:hypothetical protein
LWLINGCLLGMLLYSAGHALLAHQRQESAKHEAAALCERLLDKLDRRLGAAALVEEEARAELLRSTAAAAAADMNPGRVRLALRRLKAQLEGAELDLRHFAEETTRLAARKKLRHGAPLLPEARQRELEAQSSRLDGAWQELAALEQQADWLTMRWSQAVEQETAAARKSQAQQLQELEQARERATADLRRMEEALSRAHEQAERAREVAWEQAVWNARRSADEPAASSAPSTVVQVNTGYAATPPYPPRLLDLAPGWTPPPPFPGRIYGTAMPYYGVPSYYDPGCWPRSRVIGYGVRHPRTVRIGPYLVVN